MCSGKFLEPVEIESGVGDAPTPSGVVSSSSPFDTQVAMGTESGAIYIMTNFEVLRAGIDCCGSSVLFYLHFSTFLLFR